MQPVHGLRAWVLVVGVLALFAFLAYLASMASDDGVALMVVAGLAAVTPPLVVWAGLLIGPERWVLAAMVGLGVGLGAGALYEFNGPNCWDCEPTFPVGGLVILLGVVAFEVGACAAAAKWRPAQAASA